MAQAARVAARIVEFGSLGVQNPGLAAQWHSTRNGTLTPEDVLPGTNKKVWWRCDKGHEWQAMIASRSAGNGCPICNAESQSSFPEQVIFFYLGQRVECENRSRVSGIEVDVLIPDLSVGVEYDGAYFHGNRKNTKRARLAQHGVALIRVIEDSENTSDKTLGEIRCIPNSDYSYLTRVIEILFEWILSSTVNVDIDRDRGAILARYVSTEKANSIAVKCPDSIKLWNTNKNGVLRPEHFSYRSNKRVWWQCEKGHEWIAPPADIFSGKRCPYCSGHRTLPGFNDLATTHPWLVGT
jgi:hypothetical protein